MAVIIGSARIDENSKTHGGKAGDQTGKEVSTQNWYLHSKGWRVLRAKDAATAEKIAKCMEDACKSKYIGYDQYQRNTLYNEAAKHGYDVSKVKTNVETDCSALVRICCTYAGIKVSDFNTSNEVSALLATGAFEELKDSKYTTSANYLRRGDILTTKTKGHTVVVLSNGSKSQTASNSSVTLLKKGSQGSAVVDLQKSLVGKGYKLPKYGVDGDFGTETQSAVKSFQKDNKLEVDGIVGKHTWAALGK